MAEENSIEQKVPKEVVLETFGALLAVSPEIYGTLIANMAQKYHVSAADLRPYVAEVLKTLPPYED